MGYRGHGDGRGELRAKRPRVLSKCGEGGPGRGVRQCTLVEVHPIVTGEHEGRSSAATPAPWRVPSPKRTCQLCSPTSQQAQAPLRQPLRSGKPTQINTKASQHKYTRATLTRSQTTPPSLLARWPSPFPLPHLLPPLAPALPRPCRTCLRPLPCVTRCARSPLGTSSTLSTCTPPAGCCCGCCCGCCRADGSGVSRAGWLMTL